MFLTEARTASEAIKKLDMHAQQRVEAVRGAPARAAAQRLSRSAVRVQGGWELSEAEERSRAALAQQVAALAQRTLSTQRQAQQEFRRVVRNFAEQVRQAPRRCALHAARAMACSALTAAAASHACAAARRA